MVSEEEALEGEQKDIQTSVAEVDLCPLPTVSETVSNVDINPNLSSSSREEIENLLQTFSDVLTDSPGTTSLIEHDIQLTTTEPFRVKGYPVPFHLRETVKQEVDKMLRLGVIEPSNAQFASPIVLVQK